MNILGKAKEHSLLQQENKYVFNEIYFGEEGLTSASANHLAALATVQAQELKAKLNSLRLYQKSIQVIDGNIETIVETVNNTLSEFVSTVHRICKLNSLVAWFREAVKERREALDNVANISVEEFCKMSGRKPNEKPVMPQSPIINFQDIKTILDAGLSIKEYNRYLELNSTLAVFGDMIHEKGVLTLQKQKLDEIKHNPALVKESGRDTIITRYLIDDLGAIKIEKVYEELQAEYRKLQAEKNGIDAKWSKLSAEYQVNKNNEYKYFVEEYRKKLEEYFADEKELNTQLAEWKKEETDRISSLKIVIPNALMDTYKFLTEKYC